MGTLPKQARFDGKAHCLPVRCPACRYFSRFGSGEGSGVAGEQSAWLSACRILPAGHPHPPGTTAKMERKSSATRWGGSGEKVGWMHEKNRPVLKAGRLAFYFSIRVRSDSPARSPAMNASRLAAVSRPATASSKAAALPFVGFPFGMNS